MDAGKAIEKGVPGSVFMAAVETEAEEGGAKKEDKVMTEKGSKKGCKKEAKDEAKEEAEDEADHSGVHGRLTPVVGSAGEFVATKVATNWSTQCADDRLSCRIGYQGDEGGGRGGGQLRLSRHVVMESITAFSQEKTGQKHSEGGAESKGLPLLVPYSSGSLVFLGS